MSRTPPLPFPVEYKRGRPKKHGADAVQLCAQAMCLEEMLDVAVPAGALFYGKNKRRKEVAFDDALRLEVRQCALGVHELLARGRTPRPVNDDRCRACSLVEICMPRGRSHSALRYLKGILDS